MIRIGNFTGIVLFLLAIGAFMVARTQAQESDAEAKPKHTIKDVMGTAHKGGLLKKVLDDEATPEEKLELLDLYLSLAENKPPQGHEDNWRKMTREVVIAAGKTVVGREGATAELKKAVNCAVCHKEHKPPAE